MQAIAEFQSIRRDIQHDDIGEERRKEAKNYKIYSPIGLYIII